MVATVARNGAGFTTSNIRTYDVWGGVRSGAATGGPKGRYVANLGHVQDDESGLIYMRARYYEPESGRFISEDPAQHHKNWYVYCGNNPTNGVDSSGKDFKSIFAAFLSGIVSVLIANAVAGLNGLTLAQQFAAFIKGALIYLAAKVGGGITESLEVGGSASIGAYLTGSTVGGFVNAVGAAFIDLLTGDFEWSDLLLNFFTGGLGAAGSYGLSSAKGQLGDAALGACMSGLSGLFDQFF